MNNNLTTITISLTAEEETLIAAFAQELGLSTPGDVLLTLLHDAVWDRTFAASQDVLDRLADEAHAEYLRMK